MNQPLCSLAFAAMVSLSASALAAEPIATNANADIRIAHAAVSGANGPVDPRAFDEYAGRYETHDGAVFFIDNDGELLTIELAAAADSAPLRLHSVGAGDFLVSETGSSVTFEVDADGRVRRLILGGGEGAVVVADKVEVRGVVTIHDVVSVAPETTARALQRGSSAR